MRPTRRGLAASFAVVSLAVEAVVFGDLLLGAVALVATMLLAYDAIWVASASRRPEGRYTLLRGAARVREASLFPGEEAVEVARLVKAGGSARFMPGVRFLRVDPPAAPRRRGESSLQVRFCAPYAGEYRVEEVGVEIVGPFGLTSSSGSLPFEATYRVRPRLVKVAAASINISARGAAGGTPAGSPGGGTEFYEMREYNWGDDYRAVNWKASARLNRLVVNQNVVERMGAYVLVLDAEASSFSDADRLASTFLAIANSLAAAELRFAVVVHHAGRMTEAADPSNPMVSLAAALRGALRFVDLGPAWLQELTPTRLASALSKGPSPIEEIPALRAAEVRAEVDRGDAWGRIVDYARDQGARDVVYVTELSHSLEPLIELASRARRAGEAEIVVADPCTPLTRGEDGSYAKEAANAPYQRHLRALRALASAGVRCYGGEPSEMARRILSRAP